MSKDPAIEAATVMARSEEPVAVEVDRTVVMMSLAQGMYYGLEGPGPRIWALLERPRSVADLCAELAKEYQVSPETCFADVVTFLTEMRQAGLVRIHG